MDRVMVFTGALPQTSDILNSNKFAMFGLGYGMQMVLGTNTYVDGLACLPTTPTADLHVNVQVGSIYALTEVDASAYSDLGTDTTSIVKQGINPSVQVLSITPPSTSGQSQVFLVQVQYEDLDTGAQVESYYNASNSSAPFSGPANAGTSNFTIRQGKCVVALKAGVAASTGTQVTPSPDAGYTGLFAVTVANGQTQITSGNIVQLTSAPIVGTKLPQIPSGVQSGNWISGTDTSVGGAAQTTNASTATSSAVLHFASVPSWVAVGMIAYDVTTPTAITGGQTVLSKTSTSVTLSGNVNATVNSGDSIAFSTNALVAVIPTINGQSIAPSVGTEVRIQSAGTISGASTLTLTGGIALSSTAIHRANGASTTGGDIVSGEVVGLIYDGAYWQIKNYQGTGTGGGGSVTTNIVSIPYGADTSTSSNTITVAPSPSISSLSAGQAMIVKLANPITGATTISVSGQASASVVSFTGQALGYGAASIGEMLWMLYDGSKWQIVNPPQPLQANLTIYVNASIGSDAYDGSQATVSGTKGPLQHIQTAVTKAFNYPSSTYVITIQVADGTYNEAVSTPTFPGPALVINGNSGSPSNVLVNGANNVSTFVVSGPNSMTVQNLKAATGTGSGPPCAFVASGSGASIITTNTVSGACAGAVHLATTNGSMSIGTHTYASNFAYAVWAAYGASLSLAQSAVYTISASITVTDWVFAETNGSVQVPSVNVPSFVNPGNVTGQKFISILGGVINTQGEGVNYFPGTIAGSAPTGYYN